MREKYYIEFVINDLPKLPNQLLGQAWQIRHKNATRWKTLVKQQIGGNIPPKPLMNAKLSLTRYSSRAPDPDGLVGCFKPVIDGLVKANVLKDDNFKIIGMPHYDWQKAKPKHGFIKVIVEEI